MNQNIETLGIAKILIGGLLKSVRNGWVFVRVPVNQNGRGNSLEVVDNRPEVVRTAEKVFTISAEINAAKRKRSSGGKSQSELRQENVQALTEFDNAFKTPAVVSVQEQVVVGGAAAYQRVIFSNAEGEEPEAVFTCIRVRGIWHRDPLRSPFMPVFDRDRITALIPVLAFSDPVTIWELGEDDRIRGSRVSFPDEIRIATFERVVDEIPEEEKVEMAKDPETPPDPPVSQDEPSPKTSRHKNGNHKVETLCQVCGLEIQVKEKDLKNTDKPVLCKDCAKAEAAAKTKRGRR